MIACLFHIHLAEGTGKAKDTHTKGELQKADSPMPHTGDVVGSLLHLSACSEVFRSRSRQSFCLAPCLLHRPFLLSWPHLLTYLKIRERSFWVCFPEWYKQSQASLVAQTVKNVPAVQETRVQYLGREDPLEKGMATHV